MSHLKVEIFADEEELVDEGSRVVEPEVVYRYDDSDYKEKL